MLKNLLHITVLTLLWKKYRQLILSTLVLVAYLWLVSLLHDDYVNYSELDGDKQYLAWSFAIKWLAYLSGIVIYLFISWRRNGKVDTENTSTTTQTKTATTSKKNNPLTDPFADIRQRDKLRSRADFIIQSTEHKKSNNQ